MAYEYRYEFELSTDKYNSNNYLDNNVILNDFFLICGSVIKRVHDLKNIEITADINLKFRVDYKDVNKLRVIPILDTIMFIVSPSDDHDFMNSVMDTFKKEFERYGYYTEGIFDAGRTPYKYNDNDS
jgi:hypothetical protein